MIKTKNNFISLEKESPFNLKILLFYGYYLKEVLYNE